MMDQMTRAAREWSKDARFDATKRRITTSFIGALARFEEAFGSLWGLGVPAEQKSAEEKYWFEKWSKCRESVLDLGNAQVRAAREEIGEKR